MKPLTTVALSHPSSLSSSQVAVIASNILQADAPVVIQSIPGLSAGTQQTVLTYTGLANIFLEIWGQIGAAIANAHATAATAPAPAPAAQ